MKSHFRITVYAVAKFDPNDGFEKILEIHMDEPQAEMWAGHYRNANKSCNYRVIPMSCIGG